MNEYSLAKVQLHNLSVGPVCDYIMTSFLL